MNKNNDFIFKGTRGPWKIEKNKDNTMYAISGHNWKAFALVVVASTGLQGLEPDKKGIANAHLIQSAPDLFEACVLLYETFKNRANTHSVQDNEVMHFALSAIRKSLNIVSND